MRHRLIRFAVCATAVPVLGACNETAPTTEPPVMGPPVIVGWETIPRVVAPGSDEAVVVRALLGGVESARLEIRGRGRLMALSFTGESVEVGGRPVGIWEAETTAANLLRDFQPATGSNFIGRIEADPSAGGPTISVAINMAIHDGSGAVAVSTLSDRVRVSDHVVNLRIPRDGRVFERTAATAVDAWAGSLVALGLEPDFVALIPPVALTGSFSAFHVPIRNDTDGIGRAPLDATAGEGAVYGALRSVPAVQGILFFRDPTRLDLAASTPVHEVGHRFIAYLEEAYGDPGGAHWPISQLAIGVMGYQRGTSSERFPFRFEPRGAGGWVLRRTELPLRFNSMELYLMGLLEPAAVDSFLVFDDPATLPEPADGVVIDRPGRYLKVEDVVAAVGPRVPAFPAAPRTFRLATVVLTWDRFLTGSEAAYYEMAAARGEAERPLPPLDPNSPGPEVLPFYLATGERGRLSTRVR